MLISLRQCFLPGATLAQLPLDGPGAAAARRGIPHIAVRGLASCQARCRSSLPPMGARARGAGLRLAHRPRGRGRRLGTTARRRHDRSEVHCIAANTRTSVVLTEEVVHFWATIAGEASRSDREKVATRVRTLLETMHDAPPDPGAVFVGRRDHGGLCLTWGTCVELPACRTPVRVRRATPGSAKGDARRLALQYRFPTSRQPASEARFQRRVGGCGVLTSRAQDMHDGDEHTQEVQMTKKTEAQT